VLLAGSLIARRLNQPVERILCVQWTLVALLLAALLSQTALLPHWRFVLLPAMSGDSVIFSRTARTMRTAQGRSDTNLAETRAPASALSAKDVTVAEPGQATESREPGWHNTPPSGNAFSGAEFIRLACVLIVAAGGIWQLMLLWIGPRRLGNLLRRAEPLPARLPEHGSPWKEAHQRSTVIRIAA